MIIAGQTAIWNDEDIIDSRDIIARIEWLEEDDQRDEDEADELKALQGLAEEAQGSPDWIHGEQLIRYSHFEDYARQLAEDCGMLGRGSDKWPGRCIDWKQAAEELEQDYTEVDFNGIAYFIRA